MVYEKGSKMFCLHSIDIDTIPTVDFIYIYIYIYIYVNIYFKMNKSTKRFTSF